MAAGSQAIAGAAVENDSVRSRFAIGAFWALFGAALSRGMTLVGSIVAGRLLGATGFGELGMIQSTQGLFGVLAGAGLGLAATKYVAEYRALDWSRAGRCVALATLSALALGLVAALALFAFSGTIAGRVLGAPRLEKELQIATGLVLFAAINGVQTGAIAGLGNFRALACLSIVRAAFLFALLVAGIALAGVRGGVIGLVLAEGISVLANQLALRRYFPELWFGWRQCGTLWKEIHAMGRFSVLAVLGSLATMLAMWWGNVVLVSQPEGYAALGLFNAADRWRQLLLFLPASVSPIILSMLSNLHGKNDPTGHRQLVNINLWVCVITVLLPAAAVMLLAPWAMSVFGSEYQEGSATLVILSASALAVVANNFLGQILVSRGAIWARFLVDVFLACVLAFVSWQLIPAYRDTGLALASLVAYAATVLALVWVYLKNRNAPLTLNPQ